MPAASQHLFDLPIYTQFPVRPGDFRVIHILRRQQPDPVHDINEPYELRPILHPDRPLLLHIIRRHSFIPIEAPLIRFIQFSDQNRHPIRFIPCLLHRSMQVKLQPGSGDPAQTHRFRIQAAHGHLIPIHVRPVRNIFQKATLLAIRGLRYRTVS